MDETPSGDALDAKRSAFLNALNEGGGAAEAADFLDNGGEINAVLVPFVDQTLLHYAAINRRTDLIDMLSRRGADFNVRNAFGMTALHLAIQHEVDAILAEWQEPDFPCARALIRRGAMLDAIDKLGRSPRDLAQLYGPDMAALFDKALIT